MEVKIISLNKAVELGLTNYPSGKASGEAGLSPQFAFIATGKVGSDKALEIKRKNLKTGEITIIHEDKEYKKEKRRLKINEYAVDKKSDITSNPL